MRRHVHVIRKRGFAVRILAYLKWDIAVKEFKDLGRGGSVLGPFEGGFSPGASLVGVMVVDEPHYDDKPQRQ